MNLKSRKLIIGIVSAVLVIINDLLGHPVSNEAIFTAAGILGACIIGLGIADAGAAKANGAQVTKVVEKAIGDVKIIETEMHGASKR